MDSRRGAAAPAPVRRRDLGLSLLAWGAAVRRDLPWRHTRDPWAICVSEVMLQQTQADRVVPRWHAFLGRFPDVFVAANAGSGALVEEWAGLGYNRRAVYLWRIASTVVERHGGEFPSTLADLMALPGIGPYTARAILAFAFEDDVAVVDTNVARWLARTAGRTLTLKEVQTRADSLVPPGEGWAWNQAAIDLGATVCTARRPRCDVCPLADGCAWRASDDVDPAVGSAGVSGKQSRFAGSDRQGRGRLVDALRAAPVALADVPAAMGWPTDPERANRVARTLLVDGLAIEIDGAFRLA